MDSKVYKLCETHCDDCPTAVPYEQEGKNGLVVTDDFGNSVFIPTENLNEFFEGAEKFQEENPEAKGVIILNENGRPILALTFENIDELKKIAKDLGLIE